MGTTFGLYSKFYNLLYEDKNYRKEVDFVDELINENRNNTKSILDLGCGTGIHAELLYDKGYEVCGVDMSEDMLVEARKSAQTSGKEIEYICSNIIDLDISERFDVITSLFHVFSYLNSNDDLLVAFKKVSDHLNPGGLFIFDFWYGPGVLSERPVTKIKRVESEDLSCVRLSEPLMHSRLNCVDVNFELFVNEKESNQTETSKETHRMRYFFDMELELFAEITGFKVKNKHKWLSHEVPDFDTWNAVWVLEKK